jgi:hypothetical protein
MIGFPKKERGGAGLSGREEVHIFRDPPKSIHTRKFEPVSSSDVSYMSRESTDRISENIMQFAKKVNPMNSVNYGQQSIYKINEKFVPPMFRQEDLLPLSRQRRDLTSVTTNIESPYLYKNTTNEYKIDYEPIKASIRVNPNADPSSGGQYSFNTNVVLNKKQELYSIHGNKVAPNNIYNTYAPDMNLNSKTKAGYVKTTKEGNYENQIQPDTNLVNQNIVIKPVISVNTPIGNTDTISITNLENRKVTSQIIDKPLRAYLPKSFEIAFYSPSTNQYREIVLAENIKEKIAVDTIKGSPIEIHSQVDMQLIKLKDYNWAIHQTSTGSSTLIIETQDRPDLYLNRNTPLTNALTNKSSEYEHQSQINTKELVNNRPMVNYDTIRSYNNILGTDSNINREYKLKPSLNVGGFLPQADNPTIYVKQPFDRSNYNRTQLNKNFIRQQLNDNNNV